MKKLFAAVLVLTVVSLGLIALFGDHLKALFGTSADSLAGEPYVASRSSGKVERKRLAEFARAAAPLPPSRSVATARDALSTFAIDVDTASYTWARRLVLESQALPPHDGVRVEEWVNAFDYDLPAPDTAPFAIHVQGATSPFDETKTLVKVALQGRRVSEANRKPAHLVFLADVSGSMQGPDRLPLAKRALEVLSRQLKPSDTVALVTYAGRAEVVLPPTSAAKQDRVLAAIRSLETGGGTNMGSGMELAYKLAVGQLQPGTTTRVIVLTDGDTNIGPNLSHTQLLESVKAYVDEGVTLTTVGFGMGNYRGHALEQLADQGNGQALYVDSEKAIDRVFRQQLTGTLEVIAKDVKVQVQFDPAVVTDYRLLGYENRALADEDFRDDRVDAGELGAGHAVTALYEVTLTSAGAKLGQVSVRGKLPEGSEVFEVSAPVTREAVSHALLESNEDLRFAAAVALGADTLRGNTVGTWSLPAIAELAQSATGGREERAEFVRLLRRAEELRVRPIVWNGARERY